MPKAEAGSTKWLSNNMKSKGLQRLRWYCQACQRQMRDENGFKQHTMSEGHVRAMLLVGEDPRKYINEFSNTFKSDFLRLLKTAHGEKKVHANNFYQEYIGDKEHIHMNSTKWPSLTEFVKYLGREGICRVEEGERGLEIAWVDDSPEALRRREDVRKKERMEKGDEDREARLLAAQIKRANEQRAEKKKDGDEEEDGRLKRAEGQAIVFSLGAATPAVQAPAVSTPSVPEAKPETALQDSERPSGAPQTVEQPPVAISAASAPATASTPASTPKIALSLGGGASKPAVNVFSKSSNPLKQKKTQFVEQPKKMSELERTMKQDQEEQQRKRIRGGPGNGGAKRQRMG